MDKLLPKRVRVRRDDAHPRVGSPDCPAWQGVVGRRIASLQPRADGPHLTLFQPTDREQGMASTVAVPAVRVAPRLTLTADLMVMIDKGENGTAEVRAYPLHTDAADGQDRLILAADWHEVTGVVGLLGAVPQANAERVQVLPSFGRVSVRQYRREPYRVKSSWTPGRTVDAGTHHALIRGDWLDDPHGRAAAKLLEWLEGLRS